MKICVIFTGGTIGSRIGREGYICTDADMPYLLLERYKEISSGDVWFVTKEPYCILSENLSAEHIMKLADSVQQALSEKAYDGIIVTHGTDTLQYSGAILGYLFGHAPIPILLVSSNYVLDDSRANGLDNFKYAVEFIKGNCGTGVFVSYCNQGEEAKIHRGTRLQLPVSYSDEVSSVDNSYYGSFRNNKFIKNDQYQTVEGVQSILGLLNVVDKEGMRPSEYIKLEGKASEILRVRPYVGMNYPQLSSGIKVVLHESYHSGTICVGEDMKEFMASAKRLGILVYLTGLSNKEDAYETVEEYQNANIISLPDSATIAQYCKLWICISAGMNVEEVMKVSIAEDFI